MTPWTIWTYAVLIQRKPIPAVKSDSEGSIFTIAHQFINIKVSLPRIAINVLLFDNFHQEPTKYCSNCIVYTNPGILRLSRLHSKS